MRRKRPEKAILEKLIESGMSRRAIATSFNTDVGTVGRWKRHYGLLVRRMGIKADLPEITLRALTLQGLTTLQIADKLHRHERTVRRYRKIYGIDERQPSHQPNPFFEISQAELQIFLGSTLGDGTLFLSQGTYPGFSEGKKYAHRPYLEWKAEQLVRFKPHIFDRMSCGYSSTVLQTKRWPNLAPLRQAFYPEGKKVVPKGLMNELRELGLAVWFQDDGSYDGHSASLATYGFTTEENEWLAKEYFPLQWGLTPRLDRKKRRHGEDFMYALRFRVADTRIFIDLVRPWIVPVMSYKVGTQA